MSEEGSRLSEEGSRFSGKGSRPRHSASSRPPPARWLVAAGAAALVATIVVGIYLAMAACSGPTGPAVAPTASATGRVQPTPSATSTPLSVRSPTAPRATPPSPTPPRAARPAHLARSAPVRLQVPAIGVDSSLMSLGLQADGTMQVPPGGFPAGWYTGGPTPGELGPAVIAGHVDLKGPGVFHNLHTLKAGDLAVVTRKDGSKPLFRVTRVARFSKDQFPTKAVYGNTSRSVLRLITCGGSFNSATGHYEDNIIAFADLLAP